MKIITRVAGKVRHLGDHIQSKNGPFREVILRTQRINIYGQKITMDHQMAVPVELLNEDIKVDQFLHTEGYVLDRKAESGQRRTIIVKRCRPCADRYINQAWCEGKVMAMTEERHTLRGGKTRLFEIRVNDPSTPNLVPIRFWNETWNLSYGLKKSLNIKLRGRLESIPYKNRWGYEIVVEDLSH